MYNELIHIHTGETNWDFMPILENLIDHYGLVTIASWFDQSRIILFNENRLVLCAAQDFLADIIRRRCSIYIMAAVQSHFGCSIHLEILGPGDNVPVVE